MKAHPPITDRGRSEGGQMLVMAVVTAILLLGFLGLVVDVGRLFVVRQQLRNACDAAAMAGAAWLPVNSSEARADALRYFLRNTGGSVSLSPIPNDTDVTVDGTGDVIHLTLPYNGDGSRLRVRARRAVASHFMQLLGIPSTNVSAFAEAIGWGRESTNAITASGYTNGKSQPLPRFRPDGERYALVIEGNNLTFGTDSSGRVVAPVATTQNLYIDTNNSLGNALFGDTTSSNYIQANSQNSPGLLNPTAGAVSGSAILDPQYYLDQAANNHQVRIGSQVFEDATFSGFYFVYGDLTLGKRVVGTATFAATGKITITESDNHLVTADAQNRILFYAGCDPTLDASTYFQPGNSRFSPDARCIVMDDNNSTYYGTLYSPFGYVMSSSNQTTIVGAMVGDGIAITQYANNLTVNYDPNYAPCTAPGSRLTN